MKAKSGSGCGHCGHPASAHYLIGKKMYGPCIHDADLAEPGKKLCPCQKFLKRNSEWRTMLTAVKRHG